MNKYLRWVLLFSPAFAVELFCYATNWIACIFTRWELRTDRVKILDNKQVSMLREYPLKWLNLYNTHDNAIDEWWYGAYNTDSHFKWLREATQDDYNNSWLLRYVCRLHWLYRNNAYGFLYAWFSRPVEPMIKQYQSGIEGRGFWYNLEIFKNSFMLEAHISFLHFFGILLWGYTLTLWLLESNLWYVVLMSLFAYLATLNTRYFSIKMGWKSHKTFPRKMYANRIPPFGIRQYE